MDDFLKQNSFDQFLEEDDDNFNIIEENVPDDFEVIEKCNTTLAKDSAKVEGNSDNVAIESNDLSNNIEENTIVEEDTSLSLDGHDPISNNNTEEKQPTGAHDASSPLGTKDSIPRDKTLVEGEQDINSPTGVHDSSLEEHNNISNDSPDEESCSISKDSNNSQNNFKYSEKITSDSKVGVYPFKVDNATSENTTSKNTRKLSPVLKPKKTTKNTILEDTPGISHVSENTTGLKKNAILENNKSPDIQPIIVPAVSIGVNTENRDTINEEQVKLADLLLLQESIRQNIDKVLVPREKALRQKIDSMVKKTGKNDQQYLPKIRNNAPLENADTIRRQSLQINVLNDKKDGMFSLVEDLRNEINDLYSRKEEIRLEIHSLQDIRKDIEKRENELRTVKEETVNIRQKNQKMQEKFEANAKSYETLFLRKKRMTNYLTSLTEQVDRLKSNSTNIELTICDQKRTLDKLNRKIRRAQLHSREKKNHTREKQKNTRDENNQENTNIEIPPLDFNQLVLSEDEMSPINTPNKSSGIEVDLNTLSLKEDIPLNDSNEVMIVNKHNSTDEPLNKHNSNEVPLNKHNSNDEPLNEPNSNGESSSSELLPDFTTKGDTVQSDDLLNVLSSNLYNEEANVVN